MYGTEKKYGLNSEPVLLLSDIYCGT